MDILKSILFFPKNHPKAWFSLKALLLAIVTALLGVDKLSPDPADQPKLSVIVSFFSSGLVPLILLIATPMIIIIFDLIVLLLDNFDKKISYESYKSIVTAFNQIVGYKLDRFIKSKVKTNEPYCLTVTQPELQIEEITQQIYNTVRYLVGSKEIKVVLAEVENRQITKISCYAPKGHFPDINSNSFEGTFLEWILHIGRFDCIEDLEKNFTCNTKKRKPYRYSHNNVESGSIMGFPIKKPNGNGSFQFVITIKSDECVFSKSSKDRICKVIEMFVVRIQLEKQLQTVRNQYIKCEKYSIQTASSEMHEQKSEG
jgi:hypothetical protein